MGVGHQEHFAFFCFLFEIVEINGESAVFYLEFAVNGCSAGCGGEVEEWGIDGCCHQYFVARLSEAKQGIGDACHYAGYEM